MVDVILFKRFAHSVGRIMALPVRHAIFVFCTYVIAQLVNVGHLKILYVTVSLCLFLLFLCCFLCFRFFVGGNLTLDTSIDFIQHHFSLQTMPFDQIWPDLGFLCRSGITFHFFFNLVQDLTSDKSMNFIKNLPSPDHAF